MLPVRAPVQATALKHTASCTQESAQYKPSSWHTSFSVHRRVWMRVSRKRSRIRSRQLNLTSPTYSTRSFFFFLFTFIFYINFDVLLSIGLGKNFGCCNAQLCDSAEFNIYHGHCLSGSRSTRSTCNIISPVVHLYKDPSVVGCVIHAGLQHFICIYLASTSSNFSFG